MPTESYPSPVCLNIELGSSFLIAMLDRFGVQGWNCWLDAMEMGGYMPLGWGEHEYAPPIWYWLDFEAVDLTGRNLDQIELTGLVWCKAARFDSASLIGAKISCCPYASFKAADLREANFECSDITACDFSDAKIDGIKLTRATYDVRFPPVGLTDDLRQCTPESPAEQTGAGATQYPVEIAACLTRLWMNE